MLLGLGFVVVRVVVRVRVVRINVVVRVRVSCC